MDPLPKKMVQGQRPAVVYEGTHFVASPYKIVSQETEIETASIIVIDYTKMDPSKEDGDRIFLGKYRSKAPYSYSPMFVHYENSSPCVSITTLVREIEISHWGNVAVEEYYELWNTGAALVGPFSRLDYQHGMIGNSFEELVMQLPGDATDVYYRDVIGNISTSHVWPDGEGKLRFEYKPRFVMFGQWKTQFLMGYNLPASSYITYEGSRYTLDIDFAKDVEDAIIDHMEVRVIFPEGSSDIEINTPHRSSEVSSSIRKTFLDVQGRPVVSFTASDLVSDHNDPMRIKYSFSTTNLFWEPFYVISAFFTLCAITMIAVRVDLSISPDKEDNSRLSSSDKKRVHELRRILTARLDAYAESRSNNANVTRKAAEEIRRLTASATDAASKITDSEMRRTANVIERTEKERAQVRSEIAKLQKKKSAAAEQELQELHERATQAEGVIRELVERLE